MGKDSKILWTNHTFNPWIGCTKVSPGCDHCYAERFADTRMGKVVWGPGNRRIRTAKSTWQQPLAWDRAAAKTGDRTLVFCASLADVFDPEVPTKWRDELYHLIAITKNLTWLLLTKRPENMTTMLPASWGDGTGWNVWLGVTAEEQRCADYRIPILLSVPAKLRFVSCEPLLGPVHLESWLGEKQVAWVIAGGESGPQARRMRSEWVRSLRDQAEVAKVPFLFKQWSDDPGIKKLPGLPMLDGVRHGMIPSVRSRT